MITNTEKWKKWEEGNKDDYGKACVAVAREVMRLLDEDETPLHTGYFPDVNTTHGIICEAEHNIEAGGITGFMAGAVAQMIFECHSRGEEFRKIWNEPYNPDAEGVVNPALVTIEVKK